jgi:aminoglycoside/choline kinase family phosphotransferase
MPCPRIFQGGRFLKKLPPLDPPAKTSHYFFIMENDKEYLKIRLKHVNQIKKIRGEASNRTFYRVFFNNYSLVAMVYPAVNREEIEKIVKLTDTYLQNRINVPKIEEIIDDRVILQEDLGDLLAQKAFSMFNKQERKKILETVADILIGLKGVSITHTNAVLDTARMKWEMDFFLTHFARNYLTKDSRAIKDFQERLYRMVERIQPINTFAHRDFHSRNMLVHKNDIYLVDFQDSLKASPWYDLVSFAFDCYLDLKSQRKFLLNCLKERGMIIDEEQFYIAALQRNIKALGTFGYQVTVKKNLSYKKYIPRTLRHITSNPLFQYSNIPSFQL